MMGGFGSTWSQLNFEKDFQPSPSNVNYACDPKLGIPRSTNCERVRFEMKEDGDIFLDPIDGPIIKVVGAFRPKPALPIYMWQGRANLKIMQGTAPLPLAILETLRRHGT